MTRADGWSCAAVAAAASLPFALGPLAGKSLYFRDLSRQFLPLRRLAAEGMREGALVYWNPWAHEGEPLALPPLASPFDALQALRPDEAWLSLLVALHVPLAAVSMLALARRGLGLSRPAAAGAALVYALGGFALSTVNLYVYVQALAWAPAAILGLLCAARGGPREVAVAAAAVFLLVSTTAAELIAQAAAVAVVLALPARRDPDPARAGGALRVATALLLGAALAAPTAAVVAGVTADSARAAGLHPDVVLAHSVHPLTLAQVVTAGFYGDPARLTERWWGQNFFPQGFPYFLSLYLGLAAVALAATGAAGGRGPRLRLAIIAVVGLLVALGRWGPAAPLVEMFPPARLFRYPSKAFFSVHLAAGLLAGLGLDALRDGARAAWRRLALVAGVAGLAAATAPAWPLLAPGTARWFAAGFFPPGVAWPERVGLLRFVLWDAATGGLVALAVGAIALLALRGRLPARGAGAAIVALVAADLLRAGAGLNPAVEAGFFAPSPEIARHHDGWRAAGRVFTCEPTASAAYAEARAARTRHELWTFATLRDTAAPFFNVTSRLPTALSPDLTMLVPPQRVADVRDAACADLGRLIGPLRLAGVARVLSLEPLDHPDLARVAEERPPALDPLAVHVYALRDPLPRASVVAAVEAARSPAEAAARTADPAFDPRAAAVVEADGPLPGGARGAARVVRDAPGHIEVAVAAEGPAVLIVREGHARGWTAAVDGLPARVLRANARHLAVTVPAGARAVRLDYRPPGLRTGVAIALLAAAITIALGLRRRSDASAPPRPARPR
jgi:hypothetical protein